MHKIEDYNTLPILNIANYLNLFINTSNKTTCFLHKEKNPSLSFNTALNYWHCFGCGAGGTVIDLVIKYKGYSFIQACQWLDKNFAKFNNNDIQNKNRNIENKFNTSIEKKIYTNTNKKIYKWIINNLKLSDEAFKYLNKQRKLKTNIIEQLKIADIKQTDTFFKKAIERWGIKKLVNAGLIKIDRDNDRKKLRFIWRDNVIIFPFYDEQEEIVYLQARRISNLQPKYINLYNVQPQLYNLNILNRLKAGDRLCICEGVIDAITLYQYNYNSIGVPGVFNFNKNWIEKFIKYQIYIVPDNDIAGINFADGMNKLFMENGKLITLIKLPISRKDANDYFAHFSN
ncbi:MAG: hypothetical protein EHM58_13960 [Ignavibacteriae bacterium]|nr:MAG: hypothetical protein EHM58_13960 [Ignavibacteriota bacterium]